MTTKSFNEETLLHLLLVDCYFQPISKEGLWARFFKKALKEPCKVKPEKKDEVDLSDKLTMFLPFLPAPLKEGVMAYSKNLEAGLWNF